jgi:hypothetical protein
MTMMEPNPDYLSSLPKRHPWPISVNGHPVVLAAAVPTDSSPTEDSFVVIVRQHDGAVHPYVVWVVTTRNGGTVTEEDVLSSGFYKATYFSAIMTVAEKYAAYLT